MLKQDIPPDYETSSMHNQTSNIHFKLNKLSALTRKAWLDEFYVVSSHTHKTGRLGYEVNGCAKSSK